MSQSSRLTTMAEEWSECAQRGSSAVSSRVASYEYYNSAPIHDNSFAENFTGVGSHFDESFGLDTTPVTHHQVDGARYGIRTSQIPECHEFHAQNDSAMSSGPLLTTDWVEPGSDLSPDQLDIGPSMVSLYDPDTTRISSDPSHTFQRPVFGYVGRNSIPSYFSPPLGTGQPITRALPILTRPQRRRQRTSGHAPDANEGFHLDHKQTRTHATDVDGQLACHFWKSDPQWFVERLENERIFKTCKQGFETIKDLKDHLKRVHTRDHVCHRCDTLFRSESQYLDHIRAQSACELCQDPSLHRQFIVTCSQRKAVLTKKPARTSPSDQWYWMWECLLPYDTEPDHPYVSSVQETRSRAQLETWWR